MANRYGKYFLAEEAPGDENEIPSDNTGGEQDGETALPRNMKVIKIKPRKYNKIFRKTPALPGFMI